MVRPSRRGGLQMCFSAEADFVSGAVVGVAGVAALATVRHGREVPFAALPVAFALHQVAEGFVWLGLEGQISDKAGDLALSAYLLFAWVLLPALVPLSILLVEPSPGRRRLMVPLTVLGAVVGAALLGAMTNETVSAEIVGHTIRYRRDGGFATLVIALYVAATCGTLLLSSSRRIVAFGVVNLVAVAVIARVQAESLTSLWCTWAAVASVIVYLELADRRRAEAAVAQHALNATAGGSLPAGRVPRRGSRRPHEA